MGDGRSWLAFAERAQTLFFVLLAFGVRVALTRSRLAAAGALATTVSAAPWAAQREQDLALTLGLRHLVRALANADPPRRSVALRALAAMSGAPPGAADDEPADLDAAWVVDELARRHASHQHEARRAVGVVERDLNALLGRRGGRGALAGALTGYCGNDLGRVLRVHANVSLPVVPSPGAVDVRHRAEGRHAAS